MTIELITRYVKLLIFFAIIWVGIFFYNTHGCRKVEGAEMEPAVGRDSFKRIAPKVRRPEQLNHEDVIFYEYVHPGRSQRVFAGRVVGLPGDKVRIVKGEVYVNGDKIRSDYVGGSQRTNEDFQDLIVPKDTVFVLCDNRRAGIPLDSRGIGPVGAWAILGKIR